MPDCPARLSAGIMAEHGAMVVRPRLNSWPLRSLEHSMSRCGRFGEYSGLHGHVSAWAPRQPWLSYEIVPHHQRSCRRSSRPTQRVSYITYVHAARFASCRTYSNMTGCRQFDVQVCVVFAVSGGRRVHGRIMFDFCGTGSCTGKP